MPREITHERKLVAVGAPLDRFLAEARSLGEHLGPVLVQLPPSFPYDARRVGTFCKMLRARFDGQVACEPRHPSWFTESADDLLRRFQIARVAADPAGRPEAAIPGGWKGLIYRRLHGSPRMYYSSYSRAFLTEIARDMREARSASAYWCIFDNTASGAAIANALELKQIADRRRR